MVALVRSKGGEASAVQQARQRTLRQAGVDESAQRRRPPGDGPHSASRKDGARSSRLVKQQQQELWGMRRSDSSVPALCLCRFIGEPEVLAALQPACRALPRDGRRKSRCRKLPEGDLSSTND